MAYNEKSKENLRSWEKGQSGNPAGRPLRSKNIKTRLEKFLALTSEMKGEDGELFDKYDAIIIKTIEQAIKGNPQARNDIFDRLEGKPKQAIDIVDRKPDELEEMSQTELNEEAERLVTEINERINPESAETEEDQAANSEE
jgi:hypothetical protein